ncbi:MAG TPA: N,N-dimethylformamidase beta subunit family domain-containing protein [Polyangia bacterium]|nr:N,N-dimethylformamidase beta subunit family domain-containing protein [Polyangia bacterium]
MLTLTLVAAGCGADPRPGAGPHPPTVIEENARAGDPGWRIDDFTAGGPDFQMYVRPLSATAGQHVDVQISHPTASTVSWTVYRLGHYAGAGGRRVMEGTASVGPQPPPFIDPTNGLVECRWSTNFSIPIGSDWRSGVYLAKVTAPDGSARYAPFIVRDDRKADVIVVMPTATDAAYNNWGGESLYLDTRFDFPSGHAWAVSYDRPFQLDGGGGFFLYSSLPTARYLEANGYDVAYLADHDVARAPSLLTRARVILVLGHNEYWSKAMRDHYEAARDAGKTLGFLGANIGYWQVRYEPAADGMPDRRMIGYKEDARIDPVQTIENTGAFSQPPINRPENSLLGIATISFYMIDFPWVVTNPGHWLYAGTGAQEGDLWPAVVGIESDGRIDNGHTPAGLSLVAHSPSIAGEKAALGAQEASVYETPGGGAVFAAGSIRFSARLAGPQAHVGPQRILRNLLAHAGVTSHLPENTLGAADRFAAADTTRAARQVETLAGRPNQPGFADGPGAQAQLNSPMGIALAPDGALIVADALNRRVRRIAPDAAHTVTTLAGSGASGSVNGPAAGATFISLFGVAVAPDGTVYVTDTLAHRVRKIQNGAVATVAGPTGLNWPAGITVAADGSLYVTDYADRLLKRITPDGRLTVVQPTSGPAFSFPTGVMADGQDLLIVDSGFRLVSRLTASGALTPIAGRYDSGFTDGDATVARLAPVLGLGRLGNDLILADTGNYRLRIIEPGTSLAATQVRTFAGASGTSAPTDGPGATAGFLTPTGLAVDSARNVVYVADTGHATVRIVYP